MRKAEYLEEECLEGLKNTVWQQGHATPFYEGNELHEVQSNCLEHDLPRTLPGAYLLYSLVINPK